MSRVLHRIGGGAARHPWRVIGAWLVALAIVAGLAGAFGGALNDNYTIPGTSTQRAQDLLVERFPAVSGTEARVVVHSPDAPVERRLLDEAAGRLQGVDGVSGVQPRS
jgi:RND superfamily putative drug exporter